MATERKITPVNKLKISFHTTKFYKTSAVSLVYKCKVMPKYIDDAYEYHFNKTIARVKYLVGKALEGIDELSNTFIITSDVSAKHMEPNKKSAMTIDIALKYIKESRADQNTLSNAAHAIAIEIENAFQQSIFVIS